MSDDRDELRAILRSARHARDFDPEVAIDRILALVQPVEGIVLSREEAQHAARGLRHSQWWAQGDADRAHAIAARLEEAAS